MRIALFADCFTPQVNGIVTVVRTLLEGLRARGHEVFVFTVGYGSRSGRLREGAGAEPFVYRVPGIRYPLQPENSIGLTFGAEALKVAEVLRFLDIQLIHTHTESTVADLGCRLARELDIPLVHTSHTYYDSYAHYIPLPAPMARAAIRDRAKRLIDASCRVVAPSTKIRTLLEGWDIKSPVRVVPNGIGLEPFRTPDPGQDAALALRMAREWGIQPGHRLVLFVGRLKAEKRIDTLLRNFAVLAADRPDLRLMVAGDGMERSALTALARDLGIGDRVVFPGFLAWPREIAAACRRADLFASASDSEVHPVTYIEALAAGCPVACQDDESIRDMIHDGQNGYKARESALLHQAMARILDAPEQVRKSLRDGARSSSEHYDHDTFLDAMTGVYREVLEGWVPGQEYHHHSRRGRTLRWQSGRSGMRGPAGARPRHLRREAARISRDAEGMLIQGMDFLVRRALSWWRSWSFHQEG